MRKDNFIFRDANGFNISNGKTRTAMARGTSSAPDAGLAWSGNTGNDRFEQV